MMTDQDRIAAALPAYEVGGELGRGGWGVVLDGRHRHLGREVAIKQLPPSVGGDALVRARFVSEAKLLASLDHPHIVPVFDYVEDESQCLLVMEKLTGGTVWSRFTTSGLIIEEACAVVMATCSSLHFAHQRGILHRDVKPENLLFSRDGTLKLTDFGIAKVVGGDDVLATRAGEVLGTPAYIAPEQATGGKLGPPTDVYAAGVMLYELLAGRLPFSEDGNALATIYRHVYEQPTPLSAAAPQVPEPVAAVVERALATDPADRWPSAEAFGVALAEAATSLWGPGWPSSRTTVAVMGSGPILSAIERPSVVARKAAGGARATVATGATPNGATPSPPPPPGAPVRPSAAVRVHAPRPFTRDAEVVAVRTIVSRPRAPVVHIVAASALAVAAVAIALLGLGAPPYTGSLPRGAITVAGADPVGTAPVSMNLSQPVAVGGVLPAGATTASAVRLAFSEAGAPLGSATASFVASATGHFATSVDASIDRYVVPSGAVATVSLLRNGTALSDRSFEVRTTQQPFLTATGGVGVLLALFSLAYAGSALRLLRRGRQRLTALPSLIGSGALLGLAAAILGSVGTGHPLSVAGLALCAVLGGASATASALAALRVAKRRRPVRRRASGPTQPRQRVAA